MKKIYWAFCMLILLQACEFTEVLEQLPQASLATEEAVVDAASAETVLTGTYEELKDDGAYGRMQPVLAGILSGYMGSTSLTTRNITFQCESNTVLPADNTLSGTFTDFYVIANRASNVIERVSALNEEAGFSGNRKNEILGEAHFLRALAHFNLLTYFGRFYDTTSPFGIPLRLEAGNVQNAQNGRATVAETYQSIIDDLDVAVANAPSFSLVYLASEEAAKALKARVLLYRGDYAAAAQLAQEVIDGGVFSLEPSYADIFQKGFGNTESIFSVFFTQGAETNSHAFFHHSDQSTFGEGRHDYGPTAQYTNLMQGDPRSAASFGVDPDGEAYVVKYFRLSTSDDPAYVLRLAEMYLIVAEGLARSGGSLTNATEALNEVRSRAGLADAAPQDATELLDLIFEEKVKELAFEGGHEWFDAIRFGKIEALKSTVISENQYILPIPNTEDFPNDEVEQNPGY